jgi:hypothetical protein
MPAKKIRRLSQDIDLPFDRTDLFCLIDQRGR